MLSYLYTLDYSEAEVHRLPAEQVATDNSLPPRLQHETSTATGEETDSDTALGSCESATPHDPRMMNNVLVYAIADKYDIPELKDLAKCKFDYLARSKWPHDDFHAVTEAVFSTTSDGDMGLRQIVLDICGQHFQDILEDEESRAAFLDNKAITTTVLDAAVRKNKKNKELLDASLAQRIALEFELSEAKSEIEEALEGEMNRMSRIDALLKSANEISECRHCHEKFHWYLERLGSASALSMQLRCASCRTRHTL